MHFPHSSSDIDESDRAAVDAVLTGNFPGTGPQVETLENQLKERTGRGFCLAVQSGFQGLVLALRALDLPLGSAVALPALTCSSVAAAILNAGLKPVVCDVRKDLTIDPLTIPSQSAAVVAPHAYGASVDVSFLEKLGIPWIEDCATSPATMIGEKAAGSFGSLAVFSFAGTKYLTGGNGGAVLCNDSDLAARLDDLLSIDCLEFSSSWKNNRPIPFPGKMSNLQAALIISQFGRLNFFLEHRVRIARIYLNQLASCSDLILPSPKEGHSWYRFIVKTANAAAPIARQMQEHGWDVRDSINPWLSRHYLTCASDLRHFPRAEEFEGHLLSLPIHLRVTEENATDLAQALRSVVESPSRENSLTNTL